MGKRTSAGWHEYEEVGELLTELELTEKDMARAREAADDHVRVSARRVRIPDELSPERIVREGRDAGFDIDRDSISA